MTAPATTPAPTRQAMPVRGALTIALAVTLATALGGWWALPVVTFFAGFAGPAGLAAIIGACAAFGWGLLLVVQAMTGTAVGVVSAKMGALFGIPGALFLALPMLYAFALGWAMATLGAMLGRARRGGAARTA